MKHQAFHLRNNGSATMHDAGETVVSGNGKIVLITLNIIVDNKVTPCYYETCATDISSGY